MGGVGNLIQLQISATLKINTQSDGAISGQTALRVPQAELEPETEPELAAWLTRMLTYLQASYLGASGTSPNDAGRRIGIGHAAQHKRILILFQVDFR